MRLIYYCIKVALIDNNITNGYDGESVLNMLLGVDARHNGDVLGREACN